MSVNPSIFREGFPGYQGHIPYKYSVIGKTVNATNDTIKELLTTEPPKSTLLKPVNCTDFSQYDRDYYLDRFNREYPLEEDKIFSNRSKEAQTWIASDKYKIYPQHIPGVECHVPGLYSNNVHGMGYSKSTARAIKNYHKKQDNYFNIDNRERFTSCNMDYFKKPKTKTETEELENQKNHTFFNPMDSKHLANNGGKDFKSNLRAIYKSKIATVPTVGYAGHTSIFQKPISYLNFDKIKQREQMENAVHSELGEELPPKFKDSIHVVKPDEELPYIVGYRGFRVGVKARGYHGENFHDLSLKARNEAKFLNDRCNTVH